MKIIVLLILVNLLFLQSCDQRPQKQLEVNTDDTGNLTPGLSAPTGILEVSNGVLLSLKKKDYKTFALYLHPSLGTRFSPYGYVDVKNDLVFKQADFLNNLQKKNIFHWGEYDGSGEAIQLTIDEYFAKFVYDADYLNAEKTSANNILGKGNTINNLKLVYPQSIFTESYFSGFDKKFEGMDWKALRLVFEKIGNKYYLVGVVHDQWTI